MPQMIRQISVHHFYRTHGRCRYIKALKANCFRIQDRCEYDLDCDKVRLEDLSNSVARVDEGLKFVVRPARSYVVKRVEGGVRVDRTIICALQRGVEGGPVHFLERRHVEVLDRAKGDCGQIKVFVVHTIELWSSSDPVFHLLKMAILAKDLS